PTGCRPGEDDLFAGDVDCAGRSAAVREARCGDRRRAHPGNPTEQPMTHFPRTIAIAALILLPAAVQAQTCTEAATTPPTMDGCNSGVTDVPGIWGHAQPERQSATVPGGSTGVAKAQGL